MKRSRNWGHVGIDANIEYLYHTRENYERSLVPSVNVSRADTVASFDRFRRIGEREHARVIVQHALEDSVRMPKFPAWLD